MFKNENILFLHSDVRHLFADKTVIVLGDSIQRSVYKDLVCLWKDSRSRYLTESELRAKGELSFFGDKLLLGGKLSERVNGIQYKEVREFKENRTIFRFYFITRCYNEYVESVLNEFETLKPDIIIMNSCYWDVHHYGQDGKNKYGENLDKLLSSVLKLTSKPLLVWNSALPLADHCKGGFLRQGFKTLPRADVLWANDIAWSLIRKTPFIYIDLFDTLDAHQFFTQAEDGIHWGNRAHRKISNSVLTAVCRKWCIPLPSHPAINKDFTSSPVGFDDHLWPRYQNSDFYYLGYEERNYISPRPLVGPSLHQNWQLPAMVGIFPDRYSYYTPPVCNNRYDRHSGEFRSPYTMSDHSPLMDYHTGHFSDPLPQRYPMYKYNHYKRRFQKMGKPNNHTKDPKTEMAGTPLTRQNSTGVTLTKCAKSTTEAGTSGDQPTTPVVNGSASTCNSPELNNNNSENLDVTNDPNKATEKAVLLEISPSANIIQEAIGLRKRKREEEKDGQLSPPSKQVKQFDCPSFKCMLQYDYFL